MKSLGAFAFALLATISLTSAFGEDQYFYWMLDSSSFQYPTTFDAVMIRESAPGQADSYAELTQKYSEWPARGVPAETDRQSTDAYWAKIDSAYATQNSSFIIELYVGEGDSARKVGMGTVGYGDLQEFLSSSILTNPGEVDAKTPFTNWQVIPEPTSGLLVLLGLARLSLRRKRA